MDVLKQFKQFTDYWELLQAEADGPVPAKSQLNPTKIAKLLPFVYLLELKSREETIVRLVGTSLDQLAAISYTGDNLFEFCPPEEIPIYAEINKHRCTLPCASRVVRELTFENGENCLLHSLGYPMAGEDGEVNFCIGVMIPNRRFGAVDIDNGAVVQSALRTLDYIDIGFGVPSEQSIKHSAI